MKLEVGKAYRTRDGERVVILEDDGDRETVGNLRQMPFLGDNDFWYYMDGLCNVTNEDRPTSEYDLIAPWEDEPAAPKYKAGDTIELKLTEEHASRLNAFPQEWATQLKVYSAQIVNHTPAPEPEFDWSTVKAGMAFKYKEKLGYLAERNNCKNGIVYYLSPCFLVGDDAIFVSNKDGDAYSSNQEFFIRSPEHDIEV